MIEIKAKIARADCAIYATGERVECVIEFALKENDNSRVSNNNNSDRNECVESLAWASAQLHCYRKTSFTITSPNIEKELPELIGKTTLDAVTQAPGDIILATKPKILFCDLKLQPGETKMYFFEENLPREGPPTYAGHDIKYFYRITIAAQRIMSKVQTLTVPIRVLPIPIIARPDELHCTEETNEDLAPTNPFVEKREITELEISWHHLKNVTARRAPKFYRISNKRGFVGRFCLYKHSYKLGEDIVGSLDFRDCTVRCVQFSVKLQAQECCFQTVDKDNQSFDETSSVHSLDLASIASGSNLDNLHKSTTSGAAKYKEDAELSGKISTHATTHQFTYAIVQTQVILPIPLYVSPSFRTDLVDVRWRLHFEFVTSTMLDFGQPTPDTGELRAPAEIPVETMIWNLPITVYAANPLQIFAPSEEHILLIK